MNVRLLEIAFLEYGITEIPGTETNNPDILKYFTGIGETWVKTDETAWCSAFINWCAKGAGLEYPGKLKARSWLDVGEFIQYPQLGDIVVLWRENPQSWKGHVGIYINDNEDIVYLLGGNQRNKVCIRPYPKDRVLEYVRLHPREL